MSLLFALLWVLLLGVVLPGMLPFLAAERFRALVSLLTGWLAVDYAVVCVAVVTLHAGVYGALFSGFLTAGPDAPGSIVDFLGAAVASHVVLPAALSVGAATLLPRRGAWTPTGEGWDGRVVLALATAWYALVTGGIVVLVAAGFVSVVSNLPT
ncbi:hypothetical protein [Halomicrobium salinisoli]|uniref:hypothetical protein n=1 Tax=Halomicrobium salinisoli TaxID=2878391 RepID=UPI001CF01AF0|nr:hypothetical protein [Halomicrobium salinisoli]